MNIECLGDIVEGTEFEVLVNGKRAYVGVAEYDDEAEDTANQIALSLYAQSLRKPCTITVRALGRC